MPVNDIFAIHYSSRRLPDLTVMERRMFTVLTIMIGVKLTTMPEKRAIMTLTLLGNLPMMGNLTMLRNLTMLGAFSMLGTLPVMLVNFTLLETLTPLL